MSPLPEPFLDRLLRAANRVVMHSYHHVTPLSPSYIPRTGPAIIAPNHTSALDPLIVQSAIARPIRWMMAAEYLNVPGLAWFWRAVQIIPVARNGKDAAATRAALRLLQSGGLLGLFPEGRIAPRNTPLGHLPLQSGIALLAVKAQAPIHPVWIDGSQRGQSMLKSLLTPNHATLHFGLPLSHTNPALIPALGKSYQQLKSP